MGLFRDRAIDPALLGPVRRHDRREDRRDDRGDRREDRRDEDRRDRRPGPGLLRR